MRIFLAQPPQNIQAQQTHIHIRSGICSCINRGVSVLRLRWCGHRDWKEIVMLLNCVPELLSGKMF